MRDTKTLKKKDKNNLTWLLIKFSISTFGNTGNLKKWTRKLFKVSADN